MDKRTDSVCSAGAFSSLIIRYFCSSKNLGLLSARLPLMINFRSAAGFDLSEVQFRFNISPILTFLSYPWIWGPPRGSSEKCHRNVTHTLVFHIEDMVRLFGTILLLDPIHFPKSEPCPKEWSTSRTAYTISESFPGYESFFFVSQPEHSLGRPSVLFSVAPPLPFCPLNTGSDES